MIKARGLARRFEARGRTVEAVRAVDIDVASGELVGFLGPNGAGKSTTLRMLTTLLRPTAGEAIVADCDLASDPAGVRRRIGYVAQGGAVGPGYRVGEELETHTRLYGMAAAEARRRSAELLDRFELTDLADRVALSLSGGQRRRLDLAMGLVHAPSLVFLDEPTAGLDPHSRANLWAHVRSLRDEHGLTVFLTTHYLDEADALCDRVLVIDNGRIVAEDTPDALKRRVSGDAVSLDVAEPEHTARAADVVAGLDGVRDVSVSGATLRFRVPRGDTVLPGLLRSLDHAGLALASVEVRRPTLDDVFLTLTGRSLRDGT
jgi:ABC-2 type transport system ATP-binding protein